MKKKNYVTPSIRFSRPVVRPLLYSASNTSNVEGGGSSYGSASDGSSGAKEAGGSNSWESNW